MRLPRRAAVHRQKIPYHLKKAKRLRIKLNARELGNEQSINEHLYRLVAVFCDWFCAVREMPAPAGRGSGQPNLAVARDGRVYLSWIERLGEVRFSLRFALKEADGWSAPRVIAEGANWFVNWADFPSMVAFTDGSLAAAQMKRQNRSPRFC